MFVSSTITVHRQTCIFIRSTCRRTQTDDNDGIFFKKKSSNDDDEISRRFTERREMQGVNQKSADNAGITLGQIGRARCKSPYWHVTESSKNTADERIKE